MAQIPSNDQIKEAQFDTALQIEEKRADQQAQGKDFIVDDDGHAAGVIPEDIWKAHKEPRDE